MSLEELRRKIDEADNKIVRLIAERIRIAKEIGTEKRQQDRQVEDIARERIVLNNIRDIAKEENINPEDIDKIYRQIISAAKSVEGISVPFQGESGAYSEEAASRYFDSNILTEPCKQFDDVFSAVERGEVHYGIIPIENSLEGSISRSYDLLLDSVLKVCGETELRVVHSLIASADTRLEMIKKVYSHPQALGQCQSFLKKLDCELVPTYDTAGSVKMLKEKGVIDGAAIASARAANIYGMQVLANGIEDNPNNFTRFFILSKHDSPVTGNDKTSIVFSVKHRPGSLYEFLKILALKNVNLTKIESRPKRQTPWEYNFYLDFEGHRKDKEAKETLEELEKMSTFFKVLGSYPKARQKLEES